MKKNDPLKYFLVPLSWIYGFVVFIRNKLFDYGIIPVRTFSFPVISVGNITVGGTGKTPMVEYLVKLLKNEYILATLSRGYMRKSRGFILANEKSSPVEIGDEPAQIKGKFPGISVAVDTKRVRGIRKLIESITDLDLVILDDAFQHRYVKPGLSIILFDYNRPAKCDHLLPLGHLREPLSGIKRADIIIITKIPEGFTLPMRESLIRDLKLLPHQQIFFSSIKYAGIKKIFRDTADNNTLIILNKDTHVLLVCGIAVPSTLKTFISGVSHSITELFFPDHHQYSQKDLERIRKIFNEIPSHEKIIMTTEKDAMRLKNFGAMPDELEKNFYYIQIETELNPDEKEKFNQIIFQYVRSDIHNRLLH